MNGRTTVVSGPIHVNDDSELPRLMDEASNYPVSVKRKGIVYRLAVDDEAPEPPRDPEAFREILDEVAGSWADVDEKVIEDLYEWRRLGSRPAWRPRLSASKGNDGTDESGF